MQRSKIRKNGICRAVSVLLSGMVLSLAAAGEEQLAAAFDEVGVEGTFVVYDPTHDRLLIHNTQRASERFVPASTFKIVNALVGLQSGAVRNVDEVLPYGGRPQPFPEWEHDMSLRKAMPISNVPVYQELARRIGLDEMKSAVQRLDYGNGKIGNVVDRFWLDGPLQISAVEQVDFLRRLLDGQLGLSEEATSAVQEITLLESSPEHELHGKTGWNPAGNLGWFVGWVRKDGVDYPFALNMNVGDQDALPTRVLLAKQCLRMLGILPVDQKP